MKKVIVSCSLILIVLCAIFGKVYMSNQQQKEGNIDIVLGVSKSAGLIPYIPFAYGVDQKVYSENGINLEIAYFDSYNDLIFAYENNQVDVMQLSDVSQYGTKDYVTSTELTYNLITNRQTISEFDNNFISLNGVEVGVVAATDSINCINYIQKQYDVDFKVKYYSNYNELFSAYNEDEIDYMIVDPYFKPSMVQKQANLIWTTSSDKYYSNYLIWSDNFTNQNSKNKFYEVTNSIIKATPTTNYYDFATTNEFIIPNDFYYVIPSNYNIIGEKEEE